MAKGQPQDSGDRHQLTVRIPKQLNTRLEAYSVVLDRYVRDIAEAAIDSYLKSVKLTPAQKRKIAVLVGE